MISLAKGNSAAVARYRARNKERVLAWGRTHNANYRATHKEETSEYNCRYRLEHPDLVREKEAKWQATPQAKEYFRERERRRRAKKHEATEEDCTAKLVLLQFEQFCHWCSCLLTIPKGRKFCPTDRCVDHVIPLARGGKHVPENLVASCRLCNHSKGSKLVEDWRRETKEAA